MNEHKQSKIEHLKQLELPKEMGFQAYEKLAGNSEYREAQKRAFMSGETRNPTLDYPNLNEQELAGKIRNLEPVFDLTENITDKDLAGVLWDSASYRMAEMYWLLEAKRMNTLAVRPDSDEFKQAAERYQRANEELYGKPEAATTEMVLGEVLAQANSKQLGEKAQQIYDEFVNGTTVKLASGDVQVSGVGGNHTERMPADVPQKLAELRGVLEEQFADTINIVNEYWENVVLPRGDEEPAYNIDDMKAVFELVRDHYDPENTADISVVIDPDASALSWDTPSRSIRVGAKRKSINNPIEMAAKVVHEYGVHGLRAVNGSQVDVPGFDTGMYSDAEDGERSDYLTFEEGFASLCEIAMDSGFSKWKPMHVSHYFALSAAYGGSDFRETYESLWRARVLMDAPDGKDITDRTIDLAKKQAWVSCVRVFRGTPTELEDGPVLTMNKDLAYLNGKLDALKFLDKVADDKDAIRRVFAGKYDPNNSLQAAIVDKYVTI